MLQEQQQQAAAAMAAHHSNHAGAHAAASAHANHLKPPSLGGIPPPAAAAAALGMLGHAGSYPGLYPPRTKEELIMLGLEEYANKHSSVTSPSVSSPDSHNSDSSNEVNQRSSSSNPLHTLVSSKHSSISRPESNTSPSVPSTANMGGLPNAPQLRKDLPHPFLPLSFPDFGSLPVMPPPTFLPPSQMLFPGYHPALFQHHQSLLKPATEQQHAAAAVAAMQHLFQSTGAANRFVGNNQKISDILPSAAAAKTDSSDISPKGDVLNNNHITNDSFLNAMLHQKRLSSSPPPSATKLPAHIKHDHSISALVTPNSESGRKPTSPSRSNGHSQIEEEDEETDHENVLSEKEAAKNNGDSAADSAPEDEELVVSMTPPRSPSLMSSSLREEKSPTVGQDNPIDLSMKTGSSSCSSSGSNDGMSTHSVQAIDDSEGDSENETLEESITSKHENEKGVKEVVEKLKENVDKNHKRSLTSHKDSCLQLEAKISTDIDSSDSESPKRIKLDENLGEKKLGKLGTPLDLTHKI